MAATSYWQYYRQQPDDAATNATDLSETYPVSAARAFDVRSNLRHEVDEFTQHRINWVAATAVSGGVGIVYVDTVDGALYEQAFPLSWLADDHPANLDVLIRSYAAGTSAAMSVRARVVPDWVPLGDLGSEALFDETVSVTTTAGVLDEVSIWDTSDNGVMSLLRSSIKTMDQGIPDSDGNWTFPEISMLRLQVHLLPTAGSGTLLFFLTGVMVREFA